jgi:lauroyl/myristoyl acyltransferase
MAGGGIGAHLLTKETLEAVRRRPWKRGREEILDLGLRWYDGHPADVERVATNLAHFGLPRDGAFLDGVLRGIVVHYFEKLFVLVKGYEAYWIAANRVELGDSLEPFREARETGRAVFAGQSHFGATYLMASVLMVNGIDVHTVGNFPEPVGSLLSANVAALAEKYGTARARLLNLADESVDVPTEMITALLRRQVVTNVYDERNSFCREVTLLGRKVLGGTGMDRILSRFGDGNCVVVTPFLVRTSDETFRYEVDRHSLAGGDIVGSFFRSYERRIREHPEQWYFIHEVHENFID